MSEIGHAFELTKAMEADRSVKNRYTCESCRARNTLTLVELGKGRGALANTHRIFDDGNTFSGFKIKAFVTLYPNRRQHLHN